MKKRFIGLLAFFSLVLSGCNIRLTPSSGGIVENVAVTDVKFNEENITVEVGKTVVLDYSVFPVNATNKNVKYTAKAQYFTVNNGVLRGVAPCTNQELIITTIDGNFSDTCYVTVTESGNPSTDSLWDTTQDSLRTGVKSLDFYNLNDFHGAVEQSLTEPGMASLSTYIKQRKSYNESGFVFTSSGDMWQGSADSNITRGELVVDWMNYLDCSAMALGNHEFDWKINQIQANQKKANFDFLACNIIDKTSGQPVDWVKPYTTITRNGVHIGIIGAIGRGITSSILSTNVETVRFDSPATYVKKWSTYLTENGADVILYLLHDEYSKLSQDELMYTDAIFLGHSHAEEFGMSNNTPYVQARSNGRDVGHISLNYSFITNTCSTVDYEYIRMSTPFPSNDSGTLRLWDPYIQEIDSVKNEVVGYTSTRIYSNDYESGLEFYLMKYMTKYYQEEIRRPETLYCVSHNNARSSIYTGDITFGHIYKAFPFDNEIVLIKVKGEFMNKITTYGGQYYPNGPTEINQNSYYYVLTIDYISDNSYNAQYFNVIERYNSLYPRDIMKKYIHLDFPKR